MVYDTTTGVSLGFRSVGAKLLLYSQNLTPTRIFGVVSGVLPNLIGAKGYVLKIIGCHGTRGNCANDAPATKIQPDIILGIFYIYLPVIDSKTLFVCNFESTQ